MAEPPGKDLVPVRGTVATLQPWQRPARPGRPRRRLRAGRLWSRGGLARAGGRLRYALGSGLAAVSGAPRYDGGGGTRVCARAQLQSAMIEERYSYRQEISRNSEKKQAAAPAGRIELTIPYDGDACVTRQAYGDVTRVCGASPGGAADALIGHLALTDYERTDLDTRLDLAATYGSIPILLPVSPGPDPSRLDHLVADSSACVISYDYTPRQSRLKVVPIDVDVQLLDPDNVGFSSAAACGGDPAVIMQHVGFRPELLLCMVVRLQLPPVDAAEATLTRVSLSWPVIASAASLRLRVDGDPHPLRYDPSRRSIEWSGVPMPRVTDSPGGDLRTYVSPVMELTIARPGELYRREIIAGAVQARIGGLLSGMDARLYDAAGSLGRHLQPELASLVSGDFQLDLADAFARRLLSPYQQLHFDEVIPEEARISDIKTALANRGFEVADPAPEQGPERRWLSAQRHEGPDTLRLDLFVEGRRTRRQRRASGGESYRGAGDSGELRIYVYGSFPREGRQVSYEVNALRRALRAGFDRLPARH
jgi:hypothetical protein